MATNDQLTLKLLDETKKEKTLSINLKLMMKVLFKTIIIMILLINVEILVAIKNLDNQVNSENKMTQTISSNLNYAQLTLNASLTIQLEILGLIGSSRCVIHNYGNFLNSNKSTNIQITDAHSHFLNLSELYDTQNKQLIGLTICIRNTDNIPCYFAINDSTKNLMLSTIDCSHPPTSSLPTGDYCSSGSMVMVTSPFQLNYAFNNENIIDFIVSITESFSLECK